MGCSLPSSSVHGISQVEILEWVAVSSSKGSSRPRDRTPISHISCLGRWVLLPLAPPGKPHQKSRQNRWLGGNESACQCRKQRFNSWVRKIPWRRKWQPTPAFLPGKSHSQKSLAGYSLRNCKESDTVSDKIAHGIAKSRT